MARRTNALTKQVRDTTERLLFRDGNWPFAMDEAFQQFDLTPAQIRDAIWAPAADPWRRDVLARFIAHRVQEEQHASS